MLVLRDARTLVLRNNLTAVQRSLLILPALQEVSLLEWSLIAKKVAEETMKFGISQNVVSLLECRLVASNVAKEFVPHEQPIACCSSRLQS
jgi:hypothetical protein